MKRRFSRKITALTVFILFSSPFLFFCPSSLRADVTVERFSKNSGIAGMGSSETHEKEFIKNQKKRSESTTKFTGKILGMFSSGKKNVTVYRVDKDVIWEIDQEKKTYTERPISIPEGEERGVKPSETEGKDEGAGTGEKDKEDETKIVKNEFTVKDTGKEKTINGFPCTLYIMKWDLVTENVKTKEQNRNVMTGEFWNTPEDAKIRKLETESNSFNQQYLKKMGIEMSPDEMKQFGLSMLGGIASSAGEDLKKEMSKLKGYPIVSSIKWEAEGKKAEKEEVKEEDSEEDKGLDLSEGLGGLFGGLAKKISKGIGKKEDKAAENGLKTVFESYSEVKSLSTSSIEDNLFNVPSGYSKSKGLFDRINK